MAGKPKTPSAGDFASIVLRALARELKESPKAGATRFSTGGKIGGYDCFLSGDEYGFALVLFGITHKDEAFRRAKNGYVMIRASKPEPRHGKSKEVRAVKRMLGVKAFRVMNPGTIQEEPVKAFCRQHADLIKKLKLRGSEDIGITPSFVRFRWVGTDPVFLRPRFEAFAHLIQEISGTPKPDPLLFQSEWRLQRVPKSKAPKVTVAHQIGGTLLRAVGCPDCDEATNLIAELDLADPALPRTAMGRIKLPVFSCLACLDWGPAFYDISGNQPTALDENGRILKQKKLVENEEALNPRPFAISLMGKDGKTGRVSKVGGSPKGLQTSATPACPKCQGTMAFVMQLASDSQVEFGDAGLLYTFVCPKCKVVASLIQSH